MFSSIRVRFAIIEVRMDPNCVGGGIVAVRTIDLTNERCFYIIHYVRHDRTYVCACSRPSGHLEHT